MADIQAQSDTLSGSVCPRNVSICSSYSMWVSALG